MGKNYKFGERKNCKSQQRMRLYNLNKCLAKQRNKDDEPENLEITREISYKASGSNAKTDGNIVISNAENEIFMESIDGTNSGSDNNDCGEAIELSDVQIPNAENRILMDSMDGNNSRGDNNDSDETITSSDVVSDQNLDVNGTADHEIEEKAENEIQGRRIVDICSFLEQLKQISEHNDGNCAFNELKLQKEIRIGFHSKLIFCCNICKESFRVYATDDEKTTDTMCINTSAVLDANMIGIGYSQLEQFSSVIDVPTMCNDKFKKLNDKVGEFWEETAEECMREAAQEEALAAIERGDVDPEDGIPYCTVVLEPLWSRNFRKNIESAIKGCPRGLHKHVSNNLERIRKDICCAIQFRKKQNTTEDEKISLLKSDLNNVISHVFGDHVNCPSYIRTFCQDDQDFIPALKQCNTFDKMSAAVRQLMYCSKDLILGETNNAAEHYNSIVAKFIGGKRVNFSLSNAYKYKANAAAVQYNTRAPVSAFYNTKFNTNPSSLTQKIEQKRLRKSDCGKERRKLMKANKIIRIPFCRVKHCGPGYGRHETEDLSAENYENEKRIHMEKLHRYHENRISNEVETRKKHESSLWNSIVQKIILSKDFGSICKARALALYVKELTQSNFAESKAMKHHKQSQSVAQAQLAKEENISIRDCGLYIDDQHIFLAASPSGFVNNCDMIVEIQCPLAITNMDPNDPKVLEKLDFIAMTNDSQVLGLKKNHNIYYDIQGQLQICKKSVCLFSVWTSNCHKMYVERIKRDDDFFNTKMKGKLISFYNDWLLPELVDPRLSRSMPIREPNNI